MQAQTNDMKQIRFSIRRFLLLIGILFFPLSFLFMITVGVPYLTNQSADELIGRGIGIYKATQSFPTYGTEDEFEWLLSRAHPSSDRFANANAYFVDLVTNGVLWVSWEFFSGPGLPSAEEEYAEDGVSSLQQFKENMNCWSVVADLSWEVKGAPTYISRNLYEPFLQSPQEASGPPRIDASVFKKDYVAVIRMGGSSETIPLAELTWERLNPTGLSNIILHPGDPLEEVSN